LKFISLASADVGLPLFFSCTISTTGSSIVAVVSTTLAIACNLALVIVTTLPLKH